MKTLSSVLLFAAAGLLVAGCGKSGSAGNSVNGSVVYKGNPVTGGTMLFHGGDNKVYPASLGGDGKYTCPSVPAGDYTVTIDTKVLKDVVDPEAMMKKFGGNGGSEKLPEALTKDLAKMKEVGKGMPKYVPIPEKYANSKTSTLTVKVGSGSNTQDLQLTD